VDAGNKLCPVSGDPVSGKDFVIYQGRGMAFAVRLCEKLFLNDAEKYLSRMEAKEKSVRFSGDNGDSCSGHPRIGKKWKKT